MTTDISAIWYISTVNTDCNWQHLRSTTTNAANTVQTQTKFGDTVIFVNENENENGIKQENNKFVNEN